MSASDFDSDGPLQDERPSRSARKREAEARQKLGERLLTLRERQLQALQLPQELLDAIHEAHRITSRAALARQRQYIGRLMRDIDPAPIEQALADRPGTPAGGRPPSDLLNSGR